MAVLLSASISYCMKINYRLGTENDIDQMLTLYETIEKNEDDTSKLVIFPQKVRRNIVLDALNNNTFYVAENENNKIVGFTKLYMLKKENVSSVLQGELNFINDTLLLNTCYKLPINEYDQTLQLKTSDYVSQENKLENPELFYNGNDACSYIYYGGAYTDTSYRNKGINSMLIKSGLTTMLSSVTSESCALLYGQVEKNNAQTNMIKTFGYCMAHFYRKNNLPQEKINIFHLQHKACKPELIINKETNKLEPISLEKNNGRGNIVITHTPNKNEE